MGGYFIPGFEPYDESCRFSMKTLRRKLGVLQPLSNCRVSGIGDSPESCVRFGVQFGAAQLNEVAKVVKVPGNSFLLGFCGVVYELVFAQTLSVLFGQSAVQYSLTIGIFLAGMGLGSHRSEAWREPRLQLWRVQLTLSLFAPLIWLGVWWLATGDFAFSARVLACAMCFFVGAVTGAELPLLFRLGGGGPGRLLAADYLGMLAACLAFPLWLLPAHGIFSTLFLAAAVNSGVMLALRFRQARWSAFVPLALVAGFFLESFLREWLSGRLTG
jgi:predicted membrane-bound spermidine synthase